MTLAGKDDWRLPDIGELQTLYDHIKALGGCVANAGKDCTGNQSLFIDIEPAYWSATDLGGGFARHFGFVVGLDVGAPIDAANFAWAVRAGDVAATPVPGSLALLGLGGLGLGWSRRWGSRRR